MRKSTSIISGYYLASEVGQLAGVSGKKIGQWARRGYIRSSTSKDTPRVYSYLDVAEAMVVHELEERGLAPQKVGRVVDELRMEFETDWPLQIVDLHLPPVQSKKGLKIKSVVYTSSGILADAISSNYVLEEFELVKIARELNRGGWAARELPNLQHIEVNPDRFSVTIHLPAHPTGN